MTSPPESIGFCRELCLALEFRWVPERLFVLVTAFFDESGTHAEEPVMVMAAVVGTGRQWELFERRLKRLRRDLGFNVFHSKDFRTRSGEFRGWSDEKRGLLLGTFNGIVKDMTAVTFVLDKQRYANEYLATRPDERTRLDSQFGLCFRHLLVRLIDDLRKSGDRHILHIVLEAGHNNANDAARIFEEMKDEASHIGLSLLGDITIAKKSERLPLMAADYIAYVELASGRERRAGTWQPQDTPDPYVKYNAISVAEGGFELHHKHIAEIQKNRRARKRRSKSAS